ncbi:MAG: uroporphyrinogen-III synthase [Limisphaerales bacterium]
MATDSKTSSNGEFKNRPVKSILISQPQPESRSPYLDLGEKFDIRVDFRPFIHVEPVAGNDFRKSKISIPDFSAIILTSRNAIDHFFRVCEELRIKMSAETKYFCSSETIALYLQKYIQYRKRKVFFSKARGKGLMELLIKHKANEKFLFPCSDIRKQLYPDFLDQNKFDWAEAVIYKTVASDLSDLEEIFYDMIVFFSPTGVKSLFINFPEFQQNETRIAAFGPTTKLAIEEAELRLDIEAPKLPEIKSMTFAIEQYIKAANK